MSSVTMRIHVVVKGNEQDARAELGNRLNAWFLEEPREPPYPEGALLHWSMEVIGVHSPEQGS